jgi:hypothetical protein
VAKRCRATKRNGDPCKNTCVHGAVVCAVHGGRLPGVKKKAAQRITEESVRVEIESLRDIPAFTSIGDVYADLMQLAGVVSAWRKLMQDRVSYLTSLGYAGLETGEQIRADVMLFERSLDRSAKVGEMLARLNLDERKQALDERLAAQLGLAIKLILDDLNLTEEQRAIAAAVAPKRVRELTG